MTRTRSMLIDSSLGKIFTNVDTITNASAANLIAGSVVKTTTIPQGTGTTACKIALNIGSGISFRVKALLILATAIVKVAPKGQSLIVTVKKGSTGYATATIQTTIIIAPGTLTATTGDISISIDAGDYLYFDVTQVGTSAGAGTGLSVTYSYYLGY